MDFFAGMLTISGGFKRKPEPIEDEDWWSIYKEGMEDAERGRAVNPKKAENVYYLDGYQDGLTVRANQLYELAQQIGEVELTDDRGWKLKVKDVNQ